MKRVLIVIALLLGLTSCYSHRQFVTYSSDNVVLSDNSFAYQDEIVSVEYILNREDGTFIFAVLNHSNKDIYVDMTKSVFICNNHVYDYGGRYSNNIELDTLLYTRGGITISDVQVQIATNGGLDKVLIPSGSYRCFEGFKINNGEIIVDGLNRSPKTSKGETAVVTFDYETSPQHLQNRITIIVEDEEHTIDNRLYISSIENVRINVGDKYRYNLCNNETMSKYIYSDPYTECNPNIDRY
ncbi:MAG: hypothetical protein IKB15_05615 [Alistipes sp.]|nr:hypothetical protein [Alistipes sp.]